MGNTWWGMAVEGQVSRRIDLHIVLAKQYPPTSPTCTSLLISTFISLAYFTFLFVLKVEPGSI